MGEYQGKSDSITITSRCVCNLSVGKVVKGGLWVYIGGFVTNIVGYAYWIIASRFVTPDVVGSASAIIALQGLLVIIISLGLPTGLRRFVGENYSSREFNRLGKYFFTNLLTTSILSFSVLIPLTFAYFLGIGFAGVTASNLLFIMFLVFFNGLTPVFMSLFDSMLKTTLTAFAQIFSAMIKIIIGILLLLLGWNFLAIMLTFLLSSLTVDIILTMGTISFYRKHELKPNIEREAVKELVVAGLPAWLPNILTVSGQSLAVLVVFNIIGETETGLYYLAYAIAAVVYAAPTSILGLMYPVLSGMKDGRKRAISQSTRLALAIVVPIALSVVIYSSLPFMILDPSYAGAAPLLSMLVLGAIGFPIYAGYYSYIYAMKKYKHVTALGISINGSRIILYVLFALYLGAMGVALGYTLGIAIGLVAVAISSRTLEYDVPWKIYGKIIAIPLAIASVLYYFQIHWMIGIITIIFLSVITYTRTNIITKEDAIEITRAFLAPDTINRFSIILKPISTVLFGG